MRLSSRLRRLWDEPPSHARGSAPGRASAASNSAACGAERRLSAQPETKAHASILALTRPLDDPGGLKRGAIAQLAERLDRTQEVGGSNPPSSIGRSGCEAGPSALGRAKELAILNMAVLDPSRDRKSVASAIETQRKQLHCDAVRLAVESVPQAVSVNDVRPSSGVSGTPDAPRREARPHRRRSMQPSSPAPAEPSDGCFGSSPVDHNRPDAVSRGCSATTPLCRLLLPTGGTVPDLIADLLPVRPLFRAQR
jgi:hypothetical protein